MPADRAATGNEPALRYGPVGLGGLAMTAFLSRLFRRPREDAPVWIEVGELQRRLAAGDAVVVVDVRQPEEFTAPPGHLPGAVNVPLADLSGRAGELAARREPVVLVCKTDRRSARAATELLAAGLRDVAVLRGGTDGWHRQGAGSRIVAEVSA
jgi:rhodanese-related sulfurtransferase